MIFYPCFWPSEIDRGSNGTHVEPPEGERHRSPAHGARDRDDAEDGELAVGTAELDRVAGQRCNRKNRDLPVLFHSFLYRSVQSQIGRVNAFLYRSINLF